MGLGLRTGISCDNQKVKGPLSGAPLLRTMLNQGVRWVVHFKTKTWSSAWGVIWVYSVKCRVWGFRSRELEFSFAT